MKRIQNFLLGLSAFFMAMTAGATQPVWAAGLQITVDGDVKEWENIPEFASANDSYVEGFKLAKDSDGNVFFCFYGDSRNVWDQDYQWKFLSVSNNGSNNFGRQMAGDWGWGKIDGAEIALVNTSTDAKPGRYAVELLLPASMFETNNYIISFAGNDVSSDSIPALADYSETSEEEAESSETEPVYQGIVIDGSFSDWDAVDKQEFYCPNQEHKECLELLATIFDGDYVYIYIKEGTELSATNAGLHSNGKYAITTDLNRTLVFQLTRDNGGSVSGVKGAMAAHVDRQWEIAIPKSELPQYNTSISFGLYQGETVSDDVSDIQGGTGNLPEFNGIVYDGLYADWDNYPHTLIQYATAGTQENVPDAEAALYYADEFIFGHAVTAMPAHLQEAGQEFAQAVTIRVNESNQMAFQFRLIAVDANGDINWYPKTQGLSNGSFEFYISTIDAWGTSKNIHDLNGHDPVLGKMMMTITDNKNECEFVLYTADVAEKLGCAQNELKIIQAQFGRLGQKWITTAGVSTYPILGLSLCGLSVLGVLVFRRKKHIEG